MEAKMSRKILVAYATRYGSTQEVAEAVATIFREEGLDVESKPAQKVASLAEHRAMVLGAPLYFGAWPKEALNLLARNQEALQGLPVAVFALGPLHDNEKERQEGRAQLEKTLAGFPWLQPLASEVFCGRYDPAKLRIAHRLIARLPASPLHEVPATDGRNWAEIRSWAKELAVRLR